LSDSGHRIPAGGEISLRGAGFSYGSAATLQGVDLTIARGDRLAIIGANGAGKTTLLRLLAGALAPTSGRVALDGVPLHSIRGAQRARRIAFVPQESRLAFDFSVFEIVLMGRSPRLGLLGIEGARDLEQARLALESTDTSPLADRPLSSLSSGERQRVFLARALAQEPEIILLDEPTAFLDLGHQIRLLLMLEKWNRECGMSVVFVSHDLSLAARHADRIVVLSRGRVVADGAPEDVLTPEILRSSFGVEARMIHDPVTHSPTLVVSGPSEPDSGEISGPSTRRSP
jgi:iron complex transport system ATP-binding protein